MAPDTYIHGTEPSEQDRLAALNRMTNAAFIRFLDVPARARVLEVGSGLGLLAVAVASAADDVQVVGVELSREQIAAAAPSPRVTYQQGRCARARFSGRQLRPRLRALPARARRAAGGRAARDAARGPPGRTRRRLRKRRHADPLRSAVPRVRSRVGSLSALPGDARRRRRDRPPAVPLVPRRGVDAASSCRCSRRSTGTGPPGFAAWVRNIIGNLESARRGLDAAALDAAVAELASLAQRPGCQLGVRLEPGDGNQMTMGNRVITVATVGIREHRDLQGVRRAACRLCSCLRGQCLVGPCDNWRMNSKRAIGVVAVVHAGGGSVGGGSCRAASGCLAAGNGRGPAAPLVDEREDRAAVLPRPGAGRRGRDEGRRRPRDFVGRLARARSSSSTSGRPGARRAARKSPI